MSVLNKTSNSNIVIEVCEPFFLFLRTEKHNKTFTAAQKQLQMKQKWSQIKP